LAPPPDGKRNNAVIPARCPHCEGLLPFTADAIYQMRPEDLRALADVIEKRQAEVA
jgi:hypothetical protein